MGQQKIASAGVHLSVTSRGNPRSETVILVHGFPDNQTVWDAVVPLLEPRFHVVTYDVRGAGESTAPTARAGYAMTRLVDDLSAVIDRVHPDGNAVHLVGHDWGSVQLWDAVMREGSDPRLYGRIASYTSISGPGLDLLGHFIRSSFRRREFRALTKQIVHSSYIGLFQLPVVPELIFRRLGAPLQKRLAKSQRLGDVAQWSKTFSCDGANGVNLYRANGLGFGAPTTEVPVQLIVPTKDSFLTPAVYADAKLFAPHLTRIDVVAGHWVIRTHAELIAERIATFVDEN